MPYILIFVLLLVKIPTLTSFSTRPIHPALLFFGRDLSIFPFFFSAFSPDFWCSELFSLFLSLFLSSLFLLDKNTFSNLGGQACAQHPSGVRELARLELLPRKNKMYMIRRNRRKPSTEGEPSSAFSPKGGRVSGMSNGRRKGPDGASPVGGAVGEEGKGKNDKPRLFACPVCGKCFPQLLPHLKK